MKYALVTGGARGIGKTVSIQLAQKGYKVLINFRSNVQAARETLETIEANGGSAELLQFDVSSLEDTKNVLGKWIENHPEDVIEVLVNNAGIKKDNLMLLMEEEEWSSVLNTNLNSVFYVTRLVLKKMIANRYGRIVNMVSLSGIKGLPGQTNYSGSKAGVIGVTKALAQEVGRRKITVNAVAPGFIKTDMTEAIEEKDFKAMIPMRRFGTPEEVAGVVSFLVSPEASYITGEVISVNGGLYT